MTVIYGAPEVLSPLRVCLPEAVPFPLRPRARLGGPITLKGGVRGLGGAPPHPHPHSAPGGFSKLFFLFFSFFPLSAIGEAGLCLWATFTSSAGFRLCDLGQVA